MNKKFKQPKITINTVYTRKGDKGLTSLIGGEKVKKNSNRINGFGDIDELNATVGLCNVLLESSSKQIEIELSGVLIHVQNDLFNLGNMLATPSDHILNDMPQITKDSIIYLEKKIDFFNNHLNPLSSFVLPGGSELSARLHLSRTICRRCERSILSIVESEKLDFIIIEYLNRLSDLFFILSRYANKIFSKNELLWDSNYK